MAVGRIGKTALDEVLSAFEVRSGHRGLSDAPCLIEPVLAPVPNNGSTRAGAGTTKRVDRKPGRPLSRD